jgi:glycogen(starch) synthase
MRVLFLTDLYPPMQLGGYERACKNVAEALAARGHTVRALTSWCHLPRPADEPDWVDRSLDLHRNFPHQSSDPTVRKRDLHSAVCSSFVNTQRLLESLRTFQPDLVYVWKLSGIGAAALLDLLNLVGVPWVLHLMDAVPTHIVTNTPAAPLGLFDAQGSALYARAGIISMSQHLLDEIETLCGITFPQGVELVPGWADTSGAVPHGPYLQDGGARFVTAGAVAPHKGVDLILEACAQLKAEGAPFTVDVYGDGIGEGELWRYADKARALQVDDRFHLFGLRSQAELVQLYAGYDAFLFPSEEREPFGFAPIEAAGCGVPPIMTRQVGASERLVDGVHCLKIERTAGELTDVMRRVIAGEIDLARIGRAGQRLVASDLSFDRCLDQIESVLRAHARPWRHHTADDPMLPLLTFLKHNLSVSLRFA